MSHASVFAPAPVFAHRPSPDFATVNSEAFLSDVRAFCAGDRVAAEVVAAHMYVVMRVLMMRQMKDRGIHLDAADFDDVQQELVLSALSIDLHRFDPARGVPLTAFLRRRVGWRLNDAVRGRSKALGRSASLETLYDDGVDFPSCEDVHDNVEEHERQRTFAAVPHLVLLSLDDDAREVITAHDLQGESLHSISQRRGVHATTAGRLRQRGLAHMRSTMPAQLREMLAA